MRKYWIAKGIKFVLLVTLAAMVFSLVVMQLWNWLMPAIFGWHMISFWQALGLLVLSKILFGGFHGRPKPGMHWRGRMRARWDKMTPEERQKFAQGMRECRGPFDPPAEPKTENTDSSSA